MITEADLIEKIKELKANGYKVSRDGAPVIDGMAQGVMLVRYKDKKGFGVVTEIPLGDERNVVEYLKERFSV